MVRVTLTGEGEGAGAGEGAVEVQGADEGEGKGEGAHNLLLPMPPTAPQKKATPQPFLAAGCSGSSTE